MSEAKKKLGRWSVGTPHFGGSMDDATVDVVVVCGEAMTLPQLEIERARSAPPSIRLNLNRAISSPSSDQPWPAGHFWMLESLLPLQLSAWL